MKTTEIQPGHLLKLKPARQSAYDWPTPLVRVASLKWRKNYKTPHVCDSDGNAFQPSDFSGFAVH